MGKPYNNNNNINVNIKLLQDANIIFSNQWTTATIFAAYVRTKWMTPNT